VGNIINHYVAKVWQGVGLERKRQNPLIQRMLTRTSHGLLNAGATGTWRTRVAAAARRSKTAPRKRHEHSVYSQCLGQGDAQGDTNTHKLKKSVCKKQVRSEKQFCAN
jgi:hypothetical protein